MEKLVRELPDSEIVALFKRSATNVWLQDPDLQLHCNHIMDQSECRVAARQQVQNGSSADEATPACSCLNQRV